MMYRRLGCVSVLLAVGLCLHAWSISNAGDPIVLQPGQVQVQAAQPVQVQIAVPPQVGPGPGQPDPVFTERVTLQEDRTARRKIEDAQRLIREEQWAGAVELLQSKILDVVKEDAFIQDDHGRWISVRIEANRMIGNLPPEGIKVYEQKYGQTAKELLEEGKGNGDPKLYSDVAMRYKHTEAGIEATALLGTWHLDHGRFVVAALCFERLLEREGLLDTLTPPALFKAAFAFERAGDTDRRKKVWEVLTAKLRGAPLQIGGKKLALNDAFKLIAKLDVDPGLRDPFYWPMFQGDITRAARSQGGAPFLVARWTFPSKDKAKEKKDDLYNRYASDASKELLALAEKEQKKRYPQGVLNAFHPIISDDKVIFRSYYGVHAVYLKDMTLTDSKTGEEYKVVAGDYAWMADAKGSLDKFVDGKGRFFPQPGMFENWKNMYFMGGGAPLFHTNSLVGTLSSDGNQVYLVDDVALPPYTMLIQNIGWSQRFLAPEMAPWFEQNRLQAYNIKTGKQVWDTGADDHPQKDVFAGTFFLCQPLPLGDKLYVLAEVKQDIRLLCLDPANRGQIVWGQTLCVAKRKLMDEPARRAQAAHMSYGEGILVCPTNAGMVLGFDLLNRSLLWAHSYQEGDPDNGPGGLKQPRFNAWGQQIVPATWSTTAPIIKDGKVVFAAPDGKSVQCVNLRDGVQDWVVSQDKDIYLAGVHSGKVLLAGREHLRALNLKDGKQAWYVGLDKRAPSGRGVASDTAYYLPVRFKEKDGKSEKGEVWAIDIAKGEVIGKSQSPKEEVPGNLLFYEGEVISQTATGVSAYPQLAIKVKEYTARLEKDPNDSRGRADRGELRYHQGDLAGAVDDLRIALKNNPVDEVRDLARKNLYSALTDLLDKEFAKNEHLLKEFEALITHPDPDELMNRRANFLRLVAKGREDQGRVQEALKAYLEFAGLGVKDLVSAPDSPSTRVLPAIWAQGRVVAMIDKANADQRKQLDQAFEEEWQKVQKTNDILALEGFINIFGSICDQGMQARLQLAQRLMEDNPQLPDEPFRRAEAQLIYLQRRSKLPLVAHAVDALARLYTRKGLMEDACEAYRELANKYPKVVVRDGKTGEELFMDLATDKRFLPYLDEPRKSSWIGGPELKQRITRNTAGGVPQTGQMVSLEPEGDALPFFDRYRFAVTRTNPPQLRVTDKLTGSEHHTFALKQRQNVIIYNQGFNPNVPGAVARFRSVYRPNGHLIVFSWGHYLYGIDPLHKKQLWSVDFIEGMDFTPDPMTGMQLQLMQQPDGTLEVMDHARGTRERVGGVGLVEPNAVCFITRNDGLVCIDPMTGERRWIKSDVAPGTDVFGDGDFIYLSQRGGAQTVCVRAVNGVPVTVPDFSALFQRKRQLIGRNLLLQDANGQGGSTLRLYDVQSGNDLWSRNFGPQATLMSSQTPELLGAVDSNGKVVILNTRTGQDVVKFEADAARFAGAREIHLLVDGSNIYVAVNRQEAINPNGGRRMPYQMLQKSVLINGPIFAFDRVTGKERWSLKDKEEVLQQFLLLDQFNESRVLPFATRQQVWEVNPAQPQIPPRPRPAMEEIVQAIDKGTGKIVEKDPDYAKTAPGAFNSILDVKVDLRTGATELLAGNGAWKIVFSSEKPREELVPGGTGVPIGVPGNPRLPRPLPVVPPGGIQPFPIQIQPVQPIPIEAIPIQIQRQADIDVRELQRIILELERVQQAEQPRVPQVKPR